MSAEATPLRELILRQCLAATPKPWYPSHYANENGSDVEKLYAPLNDLRVAQLVELTEWIPNTGQGYLITNLGKEALDDSLFLAQLRSDKPLRRPEPPKPVENNPATETRFERGEAARKAALFDEVKTPVVYSLIALNVAVFLIGLVLSIIHGYPASRYLLSGDLVVMKQMGALGMPELAQKEWWRLLTTCFLHFGLIHLSMNMITLYFARRIEALWGSARFLALYLICGFCASCVAIYYNPGTPEHPIMLAGASGALWGVLASQAMWLLFNYTHLTPQIVRATVTQMAQMLMINIFVSFLPGISAAAHFAGGFTGIAMAALLQMQRYGHPARRPLVHFLIALLPTTALMALDTAIQSDPRLQRFVEVQKAHPGDVSANQFQLDHRYASEHHPTSTSKSITRN
jgi:rhomboid protease GluP